MVHYNGHSTMDGSVRSNNFQNYIYIYIFFVNFLLLNKNVGNFRNISDNLTIYICTIARYEDCERSLSERTIFRGMESEL